MAGFIGSKTPYRDGIREAELRLVATFPYDSGHGTCYHFKDESGHVIVHFSKGPVTLAIGDRIRASFVVQSHQLFNEIQQNITKSFKVLTKL